MSNDIFTKAFWKGAGERALKTVIQTGAALGFAALGISQTAAGDQLLAATQHVSGSALLAVAEAAALAGVMSVLTSLLNSSFVAGQGSSLEKAAAAAEKSLTTQHIATLTAAALAEKATGAADTPAQDAVAADATGAAPAPGTVPAE